MLFSSLDDALQDKEIPAEICQQLALINVEHWGFDDQWHTGQLVVNQKIADEVIVIFKEVAAAQCPIEKMIPVVHYNWSDDASMADNNSSAFNYRMVVGKTILSKHAFGCAIDINPLQNPYIKGDLVLPPGAVYDPSAKGTVLPDDIVVRAFEKRGWTWGGRWTTLKDWHHFEKPVP